MSVKAIGKLISDSKDIVIIQADNPDGDSLASSLALEDILSTLDKNIYLFCSVEIPSYLRYMNGWDRVSKELPKNFNLSIIVDTSAVSLLESLEKNGMMHTIKNRPSIVLDHHQTEATIDFASILYCPPAVSSGQVIYDIADELNWKLSLASSEYIAYSILSDTMGLSSDAVTAETFKIMGELAENGISVAKLNNERQQLNKKSPRILSYKATLLSRIKYSNDGQIAYVSVPFEEIEEFSHEYNPAILVLDEMRMVEGVLVSVVYKTYPDGKITAKIRTNFGIKIAAKIAESFSGGGHPYAAGFKINDGRKLDQIIEEFGNIAGKLVDDNNYGESDETVQHSF